MNEKDTYITLNALRASLVRKDEIIAEQKKQIEELNAFLDAYRRENKAIREAVSDLIKEVGEDSY